MSRRNMIGVFVLVALFIMPAMSMQGWMRDDRRCDFGRGIGPTGGIALLLDDITQEELDNMTLAEIRELREKKRAEMDNMTLAEIRELREKKMAEMSNTTLAELRGGRGAGYTECPYWPMGGAGEGAPRDGWGFRKMQR